MEIKNQYSTYTASMKSSMIRELVSTTKGIPDLISFAGGFPSPLTFPVEDLAQIFQEVISSDGSDILQYGASEGDNCLKAEIKKLESHLNLHDDEMLIVNGSTNGIYYFAKTFINPGDVIICEGPSFLGTLVAFEAVGAELIPVNMDDDGMIMDELEQKIELLEKQGKIIKFIYTIPDFQNPTGVTLSYQRRKKMIELAQKHHILILEDDPYSQLRYKGEMPNTIFEIARNEYNDNKTVTSIKSFSKILGPGLRIAYVMAHEDIIKPMISWLQKVIVSPDCITERAVAKFMSQNKLLPHIKSIREFYAPYLEAMLNALEKYMPKEIKWPIVEGGIFLWLDCPEYINTDDLFALARDQKVSFIPGSKFYPSKHEKFNSLRLNFSYPSIEQIDQGVFRLAELLKKMIEEHHK